MSEDKDKDRRDVLRVINAQILASHNLNADPHNFVINQNSLADALTNYVATVRREARAEAFKDACDAMRDCLAGTMSSAEFHRGFEVMRKLALRALERAADSREGES